MSDGLWYKDGIIYELHVRAFSDSDGDGIGDLRGLTSKLDYLQDLGVSAIWLLPFHPSPLKDDGYDIADYTGVNPAYGTLRDFKHLLREAHRRGLRVITELVLNHTSDQHPWFRRARAAPPGHPHRDFYVWADNTDRYKEARIIFKDFETSNWAWDAEARAYYWHRFYHHQPDLNFDNPAVRAAMKSVVDTWFDMGVDGLRLDAVPYLYERDGTSCENLSETHAFLKELRAHIDARHADRMLLAEANQWPEEAAAYFGGGDECHMAFHFPLMPRMFMSIRMEDRYPLVDILQQTPEIPPNAAWALFLRNHDELTLEMVTDEERDYMYRVYARDPQARINLGIRRRLAPLLGNNRRQIELMNGLLFSLPGTPVIYYGDEIGMGDNIYLGDRNGVRTPMQWSADRNAGFSRANPQRLYLPVIIDPEYHAEALNVEAQQNNPHSLLWWMKRLIALRRRNIALARGTLEFLFPENRKVLAFVRAHGDERVLVVANLSRFTQHAELDLSAAAGSTPIELFGQTEFPAIGDRPYPVMLSPHAFLWFSLQREPERIDVPTDQVPTVTVDAPLASALEPAIAGALPGLARTLPKLRWFRAKARRIKSVDLHDLIRVGDGPSRSALAFVRVEYREGDPQLYALPFAIARDRAGEELLERHPGAALATVSARDGVGMLYDASVDPVFASALLDALLRRRRLRGRNGDLATSAATLARGAADGLEPSIMGAEQSNTSIVYGDRYVLKLYRQLEEGTNPDLEIGRFLTHERRFRHVPPLAGALEYRAPGAEPTTVAIAHGFVPNEGDAWSYTLDALTSYFDEALAEPGPPPLASPEDLPLLAEDLEASETQRLVGAYLESARLLGQRTAELHVTLASELDDQAFAPEPFTPFVHRSMYQSMRQMARASFDALRGARDRTPQIERVLAAEPQVLARFGRLLSLNVEAVRIRTHGDFHLGQVLYTGKDFVIIDFEGEPQRPLGTRRLKRSALADVAGMLRSFDYAAATTWERYADRGDRGGDLQAWARAWVHGVSSAYLGAYLDVAAGQPFLPRDPAQIAGLLDVSLLEKAVYEIGYELNNRPERAWIPLAALERMLGLVAVHG